MALGENQNKIQYTVTTSDDSFEFPYKYWEDSEIVVTKLASGVESNPAFTIAATNGEKNNGGTVTLETPVESCTITIERIVAQGSEADYQRGALSPVSLTEGFDRAAAGRQQLEDKVSRAITVPTTDPDNLTYEIGTVELRAGKVLGFDTSGSVSNISLVASGTVGVDADKGLSMTNNIIEMTPDNSSVGFTSAGKVEVKDNGITTAKILDDNVTTPKINDEAVTLAKMADLGDYKVIGNVSGASATPAEVEIIDDDTMATASATNIPTAESVKEYIDSAPNFTPTTYAGEESVTFPNGMIMKMGFHADTDQSDHRETIAFSDSFPTACTSVLVMPECSSNDPSVNFSRKGPASKDGFNVYVDSQDSLVGWHWQAIGY